MEYKGYAIHICRARNSTRHEILQEGYSVARGFKTIEAAKKWIDDLERDQNALLDQPLMRRDVQTALRELQAQLVEREKDRARLDPDLTDNIRLKIRQDATSAELILFKIAQKLGVSWKQNMLADATRSIL